MRTRQITVPLRSREKILPGRRELAAFAWRRVIETKARRRKQFRARDDLVPAGRVAVDGVAAAIALVADRQLAVETVQVRFGAGTDESQKFSAERFDQRGPKFA